MMRRFLCLALLLSFHATAQWAWLDANGKKVFSDRAPPPEVMEKNILKRPADNTSAPPTTTSPALATPTSKPLGLDAELSKRKALAAASEQTKAQVEEKRIAALKVDNCERSKRYLTTLQSGTRIMQTDTNGERQYLNDEARTQEAQRTQDIISRECP